MRSRHDWKRMVLMGVSWLGGGPWESLPTPPLGCEDTGQTAYEHSLPLVLFEEPVA